MPKAKTEDQCNFLLFILPRQDTPLYSAIKRACDLKVGILNSCSILNTFTKKRRGTENFDTMTYAQMAMKINIKLGGSNHKLSKKIVKDYLIKIMSPFSFLVLMLLIQREK